MIFIKKIDFFQSDLIIENKLNKNKKIYYKDKLRIEHVKVNKYEYSTIYLNNKINMYEVIIKTLEKELERMYKLTNIYNKQKCLIVGLGNPKSTSDSLGHYVLININVTRHLQSVSDMNSKKIVSILEPNVYGNTGIESFELIKGVVDKIKPDYIIIIDSFCTNNIKRLNNVIQISNCGIRPGSGIGNKRHEISNKNIKIPVIVIGIPTIMINSSYKDLIITTIDIDLKVKYFGKIISNAINNINLKNIKK